MKLLILLSLALIQSELAIGAVGGGSALDYLNSPQGRSLTEPQSPSKNSQNSNKDGFKFSTTCTDENGKIYKSTDTEYERCISTMQGKNTSPLWQNSNQAHPKPGFQVKFGDDSSKDQSQ